MSSPPSGTILNLVIDSLGNPEDQILWSGSSILSHPNNTDYTVTQIEWWDTTSSFNYFPIFHMAEEDAFSLVQPGLSGSHSLYFLYDTDSVLEFPFANSTGSSRNIGWATSDGGIQRPSTIRENESAHVIIAPVGQLEAAREFFRYLPDPVDDSTISSVSDGIVFTLSWGSAVDADTYEIQWGSDGEDWTHSISGLTSTSYTFNNLDVSGTYYFRIRSVNSYGISDWTDGSYRAQNARPRRPETPRYPLLVSRDSELVGSMIDPAVTGRNGIGINQRQYRWKEYVEGASDTFGDWGAEVRYTPETVNLNTLDNGTLTAFRGSDSTNKPPDANISGVVYTTSTGAQLATWAGPGTAAYRSSKTGTWTSEVPSELYTTDANQSIETTAEVYYMQLDVAANAPTPTDSRAENGLAILHRVDATTQRATMFYYGGRQFDRTQPPSQYTDPITIDDDEDPIEFNITGLYNGSEYQAQVRVRNEDNFYSDWSESSSGIPNITFYQGTPTGAPPGLLLDMVVNSIGPNFVLWSDGTRDGSSNGGSVGSLSTTITSDLILDLPNGTNYTATTILWDASGGLSVFLGSTAGTANVIRQQIGTTHSVYAFYNGAVTELLISSSSASIRNYLQFDSFRKPDTASQGDEFRLLIANKEETTAVAAYTSDAPDPVDADTITATVTSNSVALSWDSAEGAVEYDVEYSTDGQAWTELIYGIEEGATLTWIQAEPSTTYYFRIRASNDAGDSDWTDGTFTATTPAHTLPAASAPTGTIDTVPNGNEGDTVTLGATLAGGTYDDTVAYEWVLSNGGGTLSSNSAAAPVWTRPTVSADTEVTIRLTISVFGTGTNARTFTNDSRTLATITSTVLDEVKPGKPAAPTLTAGDASIRGRMTDPSSLGNSLASINRRQYRYKLSSASNYGSPTRITDNNAPIDFTVGSLTNNSSYDVQVRVRNTDNLNSDWSDAASATPVPALPVAVAPTGSINAVDDGNEGTTVTLGASLSGGLYDSAITYGWSVSAGALSASNAAAPVWTRPTVNTNTNVTISLIVVVSGSGTNARNGTSANRALTAITTTVLDKVAPGKPAAPTLTGVDTAINGRMTDPTSAGNALATITSRQYRHKLSSASNYGTPVTISDTTAPIDFSIGSLTNGSAYDVQVRATNSDALTSAWSDAATATPGTAISAASAPTGSIDAVDTGNEGDTATLGATLAGGTYDGNITYAWTVSGGTLDDATLAAPVWTRPAVNTDTDIIIGLTISVVGTGTNATNATSDSRTLATITSTVLDEVAPGKPAAPTLNGVDTAINGTMTDPSSAGNSLASINRRQYRHKLSSASNYGTPVTISDTTTPINFSISSLTNGSAYDVQVRVRNTDNLDSDWSDAASATPTTVAAPGKPDAPTLTPGNAKLSGSMTDPSSAGGGSATITARHYRIKLTSASDWGTPVEITDATTPFDFVIDSLTNGASYDVQVRVTNSDSADSPWSDSATSTPVAVPNGLLVDIIITNIGNTAAFDRVWDGSANKIDSENSDLVLNLPDGENYTISEFRWRDTASASSTWYPYLRFGGTLSNLRGPNVRAEIGATHSLYFVHGETTVEEAVLSASRGTNHVEFRSADGFGERPASIRNGQSGRILIAESGQSETIRAYVAPVLAAVDGSSLSATTTVDSVTLSWDAADNADDYDIDYGTNGTTWTTITGVTGTSHTLSSLSPSTRYYFRIRSSNDGGDSAWTDGTFTAITKSNTMPGKPAAPTITVANGQLNVRMTDPAVTGGPGTSINQRQYQHKQTDEDDTLGDWSDEVTYTGSSSQSVDLNTLANGSVVIYNGGGSSNTPTGSSTGLVKTFSTGAQVAVWAGTGAIAYRSSKTGTWTSTIPDGIIITDADVFLASDDDVYVIQHDTSSNGPDASADTRAADGLLLLYRTSATEQRAGYFYFGGKYWTRPQSAGATHQFPNTPVTISDTTAPIDFNISGLTNGTAYDVQVRVRNTESMYSDWSDTATGTPTGVALPDAVAPSVTITAVADGNENTTVTLGATVTGGTYDNISYSWTVDDATTGLDDATLAAPVWTRPFVNSETDFSIDLTVTVSGAGNTAASGSSASVDATQVTATVLNVLPVADAPAVAINAVADGNENSTVTLGATLTGGTYDSVTYAWTVSGGDLDDATLAAPVWTRPAVTSDTNYTIDLRVTATGTGTNARTGTSDTADATQVTTTVNNVLPVAVAPTGTIDTVSAGDEGTNVILGATLAGGTYDGSITYAWTVSGGSLNDATAAAPIWTRPAVEANANHTIGLTISVAGTGTVARNGSTAQRALTSIMALVRNLISDTTAPSFSSASVKGTRLVITYDEELDTAHIPAEGNFFRSVNGGADQTPDSVSISGTDVILVFATPVTNGQTVTIRTNVASLVSRRIQDVDGNEAVAITPAQTVTNNTPVDADAPAVTITAVPNGNEGATVTLGATLTGGTYDSVTYAWNVNNNTTDLDDATAVAPVWTRPAVNADTNYTINLVVTAVGTGTNARYNTTDSTTATGVTTRVLNVLPDADAPSVTINPVADGVEETTVTLRATLSGGTYDSVTYAWTVSGGELNDAAVSTPVWTRPAVSDDTDYTIDLRVTAAGTGTNAKTGTSDTEDATQVTATVNDTPDPSGILLDIIVTSISDVSTHQIWDGSSGDIDSSNSDLVINLPDNTTYTVNRIFWSQTEGLTSAYPALALSGGTGGNDIRTQIGASHSIYLVYGGSAVVAFPLSDSSGDIGYTEAAGQIAPMTLSDGDDFRLIIAEDGQVDEIKTYVGATDPIAANAPNVQINAVAAGNEGTTVTLGATLTGGTYDTIEYLWTVEGGQLNDDTAAAPVWTRPAVTSDTAYTIDLDISVAGTGLTATADTTDTVSATQISTTVNNVAQLPDAAAPVVTINAVAAGNESTTSTLGATLTGGTYDSVTYAWTVSGGTLSDATAAAPVWTRPAVTSDTNYTIDLRVTAAGTGTNAASGTSDTADATQVTAAVRAILPNVVAPTVTITEVPAGFEGTIFRLGANVRSGTYDTLTYAWTVSGGELSDATATSPLWTRPAVSSNTDYTIDLRITATGAGTNARTGSSATVDATQITTTVRDTGALSGAVAPSVTITAVADGNEGTTATLGAIVTGGTYDTITYAWTVSGGALSNAAVAAPVWTRPSVSSDTDYTIDLRVTVAGTGTNATNGSSANVDATQVTATVNNVAQVVVAPSGMLVDIIITSVGLLRLHSIWNGSTSNIDGDNSDLVLNLPDGTDYTISRINWAQTEGLTAFYPSVSFTRGSGIDIRDQIGETHSIYMFYGKDKLVTLPLSDSAGTFSLDYTEATGQVAPSSLSDGDDFRFIIAEDGQDAQVLAYVGVSLGDVDSDSLSAKVTATSVQLAWDEVGTADSYHLQHSRDGSTWSALQQGITTTSGSYRSLTKGERYYFRVRAVSGTEQSAWTDGTFSAIPADILTGTLMDLNITGIGKLATDNVYLPSESALSSLSDDTLNFSDNSTAECNRVIWDDKAGTNHPLIQFAGRGTAGNLRTQIRTSHSVYFLYNSDIISVLQISDAAFGTTGDNRNSWFRFSGSNSLGLRPSSLSDGDRFRIIIAEDNQLKAFSLYSAASLGDVDGSTLSANVTATSVTLFWDGVTTADSYQVERSTDGVAWGNRVEDIVGNSVTISSLTEDTTYYFRVRASNDDGESDWTDGTFTATPVDELTGLLLDVIVTRVGGSQFVLDRRSGSLSGTLDTRNSDIVLNLPNGTNYTIQTIEWENDEDPKHYPLIVFDGRTGGTGNVIRTQIGETHSVYMFYGTNTVNELLISNSDTADNRFLYYTSTTGIRRPGSVRAGSNFRLLIAGSGQINKVRAHVGAKTAPGKPAAPIVTTGDGQLSVTMTDPSSAGDSGATITARHYRFKASSASNWGNAVQITDTVAPITFTIGSLTNSTAYDVQVRATNSDGLASEWSTSASGTPSATLPSATAPAGSINAVSAGNEGDTATLGATLAGGSYDGAITYAWTVSDGMLNDSTAAAPVWTRPTVNTNTNVTIGLTISVVGTGTNALNSTSDSRTLTAITSAVLDEVAPSKPVAPTLTAGVTAINGRMTDPSSAGNTLATITSRQYRFKTSAASNYGTPVTISDTTTPIDFSISGLTNGTAYDVQVRATNSDALTSAWSDAATSTPVPASPPGTPNAPTITPGDGELSVTMTDPSSAGDAGATITARHYRIKTSSTAQYGDPVAITDTTAPITFTIGSLINGTAYDVQVRATNSDGAHSAWSTAASATPIDIPTGILLDVNVTSFADHVDFYDRSPVRGAASDDSDIVLNLPNGRDYTVAQFRWISNSNADDTFNIGFTPNGVSNVTRQQIGSTHSVYVYYGFSTPSLQEVLISNTTGNNTLVFDSSVERPSTFSDSDTFRLIIANSNELQTVRSYVGAKAAPGKPGAPSLIPGDGELILSMTDPSSAGDAGATITARHYRFKTSSSSNWGNAVAITDTTVPITDTIGSLTNNTAYDVQVRVTNSDSVDSEWSDTASATPAPGTPVASAPSVTINAVAAGNEDTTVTLTASIAGGVYDSITYAWTVSGGTLDNAASSTPVWTRPSVATDTNYTIDLDITVGGSGTNAQNGTSATVSATQINSTVRNVVQLPVAVAPTGSISAVAAGNEGATATLSASLSGGTYDGSITYAWTVSGGTLNDATAAAPIWTRPSVNADTNVTIGLTISVVGAGTNARNGTTARRTITAVTARVLDVVPDTTDPAFVSATANGNSIVLVYSENLDSAHTPHQNNFYRSINGGAEERPTSVSISGSTVTLIFLESVLAGQNVTIRMTVASDSNRRIQDAAGNTASAISPAVAVTNGTAVLEDSVLIGEPKQASYEVRIYDHDRILIRRVSNITRLKFGRKRNDTSVFSLALFGEDADWAKNYFVPDEDVSSFVSVYRNHPLTNQIFQVACFLIREFNPWHDEDGIFYYQLGGFSLDRLLEERVLYAEEDPRYEGTGITNITESGVTSEVIIGLVESCMGSTAKSYRQNPGFSVVDYGPVGQGGGRWDSEVLMDVVKDLANSDGIDFFMWLNETDRDIEFHIGEIFADKRRGNREGAEPFILSERFGNLITPSLIYNFEDEKNAAYIKQEAEDDASPRLFLRLDGEGASIPYNRNEFSINNNRKDETETNLKMITDARAELKENEYEVTLDLPLEDSIRNRYLINWDFGDKITVEYNNDIFSFQIDELEIDITDGIATVNPTIKQIENDLTEFDAEE